jgi:hypothetical protein
MNIGFFFDLNFIVLGLLLVARRKDSFGGGSRLFFCATGGMDEIPGEIRFLTRRLPERFGVPPSGGGARRFTTTAFQSGFTRYEVKVSIISGPSGR